MSVKKTVTFSQNLEHYDIIPNFSPNLSPMVLRSRCNAYGCTADISNNDSPTNSTQRNLSNRVHHHHHHHDVTPKVTSTPVESKTSSILRQITTVHMKETHHASSTATIKKNLITSFQDASDLKKRKKNISLDAASDPKDKEGYEEVIINNCYPVVILRDLNLSSSNSMNSDYSSGYDDDEDDRPKTDYTYSRSRSYQARETPSRDKISPNMSRTRLHHSKTGEYSSDDDSSFHLFGINTSAYTLLNDNQQSGTRLFRQNEWSHSRQTQQHSLNHISSLDHNVFQRLVSFIYYTCFWGLLSAISSSWAAIWKGIYRVITSILMADTYLLSRIGRRKYLLLLPLLLLFLFFWLFNGSEDGSVMETVRSSATIATFSNFFASLTNWNRFKDWSFFPGGVRSDDSYQKLASVDGKLEMDRIRLILAEIVSAESKAAFQRYATQREEFIDKIVQDLKSESSTMKQSQEQSYGNLLFQTKILSEELVNIKAAIAKSDGAKKTDASVNYATDLNHLKTKLSTVEEKLVLLDIEIAAQRNCCKNQSMYMQEADRHFMNLLFDAFSVTPGNDGDKITRFRETIQSTFVNREDLKAQLNQMNNFLSSDLMAKVTTTVREAAKETVADSVNQLRAEIKYDETHKSARKQEDFSGSVVSTNRTNKCTSKDEVQTIVKNALFIYDADKTGQVDFALESSGGSVISTRCAETYHTGSAQYRLFGIPFWYTSNSPRTVIQPEVHPGLCWAFKGTHGYLVIQLSGIIRPTAFTLEHIHKSLSPTGKIDSAPKDFNVYGLKREDDLDGKLLGRYQYKDNNESLQYFIVADPDPGEFSIIELRINSNHGNNDYTCIYRFRVHGVRV